MLIRIGEQIGIKNKCVILVFEKQVYLSLFKKSSNQKV